MAQTKETLTLRTSSFGSKCDVSDAKFLKKLDACGITELVNAFATFKNEKELKKTDGAKRQRITGALPGTPTPTPVCLRGIAPTRADYARQLCQCRVFCDSSGISECKLPFCTQVIPCRSGCRMVRPAHNTYDVLHCRADQAGRRQQCGRAQLRAVHAHPDGG